MDELRIKIIENYYHYPKIVVAKMIVKSNMIYETRMEIVRTK